MQGLSLDCRALVVPIYVLVEEGWIWVGLIRILGCEGTVVLVGSHVQGLVAGWAECSGCSGDCLLIHFYLSFCSSF